MRWGDSFRSILGLRPPATKRVKILEMSVPLFVQMFETGYEPPHYKVTEGLPVGARILRIEHDHFKNTLRMLVEHDTFKEVPESMLPDEIYVAVTSYTR